MTKISDRKLEIDLEITTLSEERRFLSCIESTLVAHPSLLRDNDTFNTKNRVKFFYLALIADHLSQRDPLLYGGSKTKEIFAAISSKLENIKSIQSATKDTQFQGPNKSIQTPSSLDALPKEIISTELNYNTLRSYLARFKDEGRLFFDPMNKRWRITKEVIQLSETYSEDELKKHWGRTP